MMGVWIQPYANASLPTHIPVHSLRLTPHRCPVDGCLNVVYSHQKATDHKPMWLRCDDHLYDVADITVTRCVCRRPLQPCGGCGGEHCRFCDLGDLMSRCR